MCLHYKLLMSKVEHFVSQLSHRKATGEFLHNNSNWRTE
jgi:hypothetical protein